MAMCWMEEATVMATDVNHIYSEGGGGGKGDWGLGYNIPHIVSRESKIPHTVTGEIAIKCNVAVARGTFPSSDQVVQGGTSADKGLSDSTLSKWDVYGLLCAARVNIHRSSVVIFEFNSTKWQCLNGLHRRKYKREYDVRLFFLFRTFEYQCSKKCKQNRYVLYSFSVLSLVLLLLLYNSKLGYSRGSKAFKERPYYV